LSRHTSDPHWRSWLDAEIEGNPAQGNAANATPGHDYQPPEINAARKAVPSEGSIHAQSVINYGSRLL
jgi:hypothetical protein